VSEDAVQRAVEVKTRNEARLLGLANVLSVGVGFRERHGQLTEEVVLVVSVARKVPRSQLRPDDIIPPAIEGVPVDVRETGPLRAI
jgi:hypothetical protein